MPNAYNLCDTVDDFVISQGVFWKVVLSNGEMFYQDDNRPSIGTPNAWIRLREYLSKNNTIYITSLSLVNGENFEEFQLPDHKDGYYYAKGVGGVMFESTQTEFIVAGYIDNNNLHVNVFTKQPFSLSYTETRMPNDCLSLIRK